MRVIKFRGYCSRDSEWRFGSYATDGENHEILTPLSDGSLYASAIAYDDIDSIGQFTGLLDKNGVEIYEGDIIECWGVNLKIVWDESDASFFADSPNSNIYESGQEWGSNCVVIGNIHEAPELLK